MKNKSRGPSRIGMRCMAADRIYRVSTLTALIVMSSTMLPVQEATASEIACAGLVNLAIPNVKIVTAEYKKASRTPPLPLHCDVTGSADERVGRDGKRYAIGFHLRLPSNWNGRFLFEGGGGVDGRIGDALGSFGPSFDDNPVSRGYAVVTMDSGHSIEATPVVGAVLFGLDPQARIDYGYNALDRVTVFTKQIIAQYYGKPIARSYFIGCSNGGRQAFMASQRFPRHFDGVVAGAPGFNAPRAVVSQLWYLQAWAAAATEKDSNGHPYLASALTEKDQKLVGDAVLNACDKRDGLQDGVVDDVPGCRFDPAILQCKGEKSEDCLSAPQVKALKRHMSGPIDSKGNRLAVDWPWDAGMAAPGWRGRPLGTPDPSRRNNASAIFLGGAAQSYLFSTPPVTPGSKAKDADAARKELMDYVLSYNFDGDPAKLSARNEEFGQSAIEWDVADSTDLTTFKSQSNKMIIYHGGSDPSWSLNDTLGWYEKLERRDPKVRDFARLFVVPGLNHCYGGPAMEKADFLTPLTEWVEHGKAPERIVGTAKLADDVPWPGRSRPFCVYPKQSRYKGSGSIEVADNFTCR